MEGQQILHVVGGSSRGRAEQAHLCFELGYHCETYADAGEFLEHPPESGVLLARDKREMGGVAAIMEELAAGGLWFPVIATAPDPRPARVVEAVKAGALDYLSIPLKAERLTNALIRIAEDQDVYARLRRRMVDARCRIANLSPREREVLDWMAEGCSNKAIARKLMISPRTVENHRANLMSKLRAEHTAQAVRLRLEAQFDESTPGALN